MTAQVAALQAALVAEAAASYGYGVVGAHLTGSLEQLAASALATHTGRADRLAELLRRDGARPGPVPPAFALPFPVTGPASALELAEQLEDGTAGVYYDLIGSTANPGLREFAAEALVDAAGRAARWRAATGPFDPGVTTSFPGREAP
ncbi:MAG TPA: ferritin-like domain-containing protein [Mycobacteriales bacterium]|nr:ferritin-like domain-containing protein [Mycobacteriales bacterium]